MNSFPVGETKIHKKRNKNDNLFVTDEQFFF